MLINHCEDVDELVEKLKQWRSHQNDYSQLLMSFSQELRNYTWDDMAEYISQIIF